MILKRIKTLTALSLVALTVGLSGCGNKAAENASGEKEESKELVVVSWGGAMQDAQRKAFFKPFEEKYGVKIKEVSPTDYGKLKAMVTNGKVEWDIVDVDLDFVPRGINEGLLEPLDFNVIDKTDLTPSLTTDYSVGADVFTLSMGYNTDKFPAGQQPTTWAEFWDVNTFPGKRTMWKWPVGTLESALLADGVDPKELYPLDVDRAFKSLDKIKKDVQVWWTTGAQPAQLLTDGEVGLAAAWNGRVTTAQQQGAPVDVEFNQGIVLGDAWVVPKGAPNKDLAMKFIAFATSAEQQAIFAETIPYGVTNEKTYDLLSDEVKAKMATSPDKRDKQVELDATWWAENFDSVNDRFQKWLLE